MKNLPVLFFLIFQVSVASAQHRVVLILLDGIPADLLDKVSTPGLDRLVTEGSFVTGYTGGVVNTPSQSPTISAVGYNHVLTGTWSDQHNVWTNQIKDPNYDVWSIYRILERNKTDYKTAIFSTWEDNRTKLIGEGLEAAGGFELDHSFDGFEKDTVRFPHDAERRYILAIDQMVAREASTYLRNEGPDFMWVYLEYTDDMGHRFGDSPQMMQGIAHMDALVSLIYDAALSRVEQGEDVLMLVTTDHGRDAETGKGHGGQTPRERTIWIASNKQLRSDDVRHVDILPTITRFLRVDVPNHVTSRWEGTSLLR